MKFTISGELPDLNTYIKAERGNKYAAAKLKKKATEKVMLSIQKTTKIPSPFKLIIAYYCKNKRKDKDNIAFAKKFILDGLQKRGTITGDGWKDVKYWHELFYIDKDNPRIEVVIWESWILRHRDEATGYISNANYL